MKYRTKHRMALRDLLKLTDVVMSCDHARHCEDAATYCTLFLRKHTACEDAFTRITHQVVDQFIEFLNDTRDHCIQGYHTPAHNDYQRVEQYPNMNNYAGKVINVRYKLMWRRGVSSIAG